MKRSKLAAGTRKMNSALKTAVVALLLALVIMLVGNMGLTAVVVKNSQQTTVDAKNPQLRTIDGTPVQVESAASQIDNSSRMIDRNTKKAILTGSAGKVLHELTSKIPDKHLIELRSFSYVRPNTKEVVFVKVDSFERVPERDALCGSVVLLKTADGESFTLDDTHLYHSTYGEIGVMGQFDANRRLGSRHGRLLQFSAQLEGFFDFIENAEFECVTTWKNKTTVVKPDFITKPPYLYTNYVHRPCAAYSNKKNACTPKDGFAYPVKPGVSADGKHMLMVRKVLVLEHQQYEVEFFPNNPLMRKVKILTRADSSMRTFQLFGDAPTTTRLFCNSNQLPSNPWEMDDNDQLLSFLGTKEHSFRGKKTTARRWRVSVPGTSGQPLDDATLSKTMLGGAVS
jgi:hypothetical protein